MNERIKELADQMFSMEEFEYAEEFINDAFMEKFAELIVAECVNMIEAETLNADEDSVHGMRNAAGLISRAFIK